MLELCFTAQVGEFREPDKLLLSLELSAMIYPIRIRTFF